MAKQKSYKLSNVKLLTEPQNPGTAYLRWTKFSKAHTKEIRVQWYILFVNTKKWVTEGATTVNKDANYTTFSIPANVTKIKATIKPVSTTYEKKDKKGKKKTYPYYKSVAVIKELNVSTASSTTPSVPTVTLDGLKLTAYVDNLPAVLNNKGTIVFQVVENDTAKPVIKATPRNGRASMNMPIVAGKRYKVRCKSQLKGYADSTWSDYSNSTDPLPPGVEFTSCKAVSHNSVRMTWKAVAGSPTYEIQWVNDFSNFEKGIILGSQTVSNDTSVTVTIDSSGEFYFRIRATKNDYKTAWYPSGPAANFDFVSHVVLGYPPDPPTTWMETNTVKVGDLANPVRLYWIHNSRDNSIAYGSYLYLRFSGGNLEEPVIESKWLVNFNRTDELHASDPWLYEIYTHEPYQTEGGDTVDFSSGVDIEWRVRTTVYPYDDSGWDDEPPSWSSEWSVTRKVEVVAPPVLTMSLADSTDWAWDELNMVDGFTYYTPVVPNETLDATFTKFPIGIRLDASPTTQNVLNYTIEVTAKGSYDVIDAFGEESQVVENQVIFSQYLVSSNYTEYVTLNANNIELEDEQEYTVKATVTTDKGLTAEASADILISWENALDADVSAEIIIDEDALTASICPFCTASVDTEEEDEDEPSDILVEGVVMSVYRMNVDGEFIKIAENIPNDRSTYVIDPHPSLGRVTYRIVATLTSNGSVVWGTVYEDVDQPGIVITWDEYWSYVPNDETPEEYYYDSEGRIGKMLKLPYNVDINQSTSIDSVMVNYIGRKRPVSYYGTQLGETISLKTDLPRVSSYGSGLSDEDEEWAIEALALLRRLMIYTGDIYIRDSSGNGYWASVKVSFDNNHIALVIPVTINVTRVEGGA